MATSFVQLLTIVIALIVAIIEKRRKVNYRVATVSAITMFIVGLVVGAISPNIPGLPTFNTIPAWMCPVYEANQRGTAEAINHLDEPEQSHMKLTPTQSCPDYATELQQATAIAIATEKSYTSTPIPSATATATNTATPIPTVTLTSTYTATPSPTNTATLTSTATFTVMPTSTSTPNPCVVRAFSNSAAVIRELPDVNIPSILRLEANQSITVDGKFEDIQYAPDDPRHVWWQVHLIRANSLIVGWIRSDAVQPFYGDCTGVPIVAFTS